MPERGLAPRAAPKCPPPPALWPSVLARFLRTLAAMPQSRHASPVRASFGAVAGEQPCKERFKASSSTTSRRPRARRRRSSCSRRSAGDARHQGMFSAPRTAPAAPAAATARANSLGSIPALLEKAAARDPPVKLRLLFVTRRARLYTWRPTSFRRWGSTRRWTRDRCYRRRAVGPMGRAHVAKSVARRLFWPSARAAWARRASVEFGHHRAARSCSAGLNASSAPGPFRPGPS